MPSGFVVGKGSKRRGRLSGRSVPEELARSLMAQRWDSNIGNALTESPPVLGPFGLEPRLPLTRKQSLSPIKFNLVF
jgi:hypothetical protein